MSGPRLSASAALMRPSVFADLSARIDAHRQRGGDLIGLHLGDSFRDPPVGARFANLDADASDGSLYRYGDTRGLASLRGAFAAHLARRDHGPADVDPEREVLVACGATHALFCTLRAVLDAGDEVLVAAPYWPLAVGVVRVAGAVPVEVPLTTRLYRDAAIDLAAIFEAAATPKTRAVYFTSPNNPDGKVFSREHLAALSRFATRRGLWVIADEVYADYVYEGAHSSIARVDGMLERTISAYSLSKSCALAGARIGFAVAPAAVIALAQRVAVHSVFSVPVAAQRIALAALQVADPWISQARREYVEARDATLAALEGAGVDVARPEGGSYVFIDFARVLEGRPLQGLLERAIERGVLVAPGDGFGAGFETYGRLCFTAVGHTRLLEGLARLRSAIDDFVRAGAS